MTKQCIPKIGTSSPYLQRKEHDAQKNHILLMLQVDTKHWQAIKRMDHAKLVVIRMEEARDSRGISVAELARRASIDRKRLWYILDGQRQMRADEFVRLCAVMGLDMGFFLTNEMKEELAYRRQKVIEGYGTGLCGLVPQRRKGEECCVR